MVRTMAALPEYGNSCSFGSSLLAAGMTGVRNGPTPATFCRTRNLTTAEIAGPPETECRDGDMIASTAETEP